MIDTSHASNMADIRRVWRRRVVACRGSGLSGPCSSSIKTKRLIRLRNRDVTAAGDTVIVTVLLPFLKFVNRTEQLWKRAFKESGVLRKQLRSVRKLHVLHVDDDPELRTIVQVSLELDPQIKVSSVGSAREALLVVKGLAGPLPDFLLLDNLIGPDSGVTLLNDIRRYLRDGGMAEMPAAFLTGTLLPGQVEKLLAAGAISVITKPFDPFTLARDIRKLLGE